MLLHLIEEKSCAKRSFVMEMDDGYDGDAEDNEAPALSGNEREKAAPKGQGGVDDEWPINIFGCMENKLTCE